MREETFWQVAALLAAFTHHTSGKPAGKEGAQSVKVVQEAERELCQQIGTLFYGWKMTLGVDMADILLDGNT